MKLLSVLLIAATAGWAAGRDRFIVLYDSHPTPGLTGGWGYSAFIEYRGGRILFDAGGDAAALLGNAKALGIDLTRLDAVIISHDDPDHYTGLAGVKTKAPVYVPETEYGAFAVSMMNRVMRFFEGLMPGKRLVDPPSGLQYVRIASETRIRPGMRLVPFSFDNGRREQALLLDTNAGAVMLTGCAHPGIETMVRGAGAGVRAIAGGLHLTDATPSKIREAATTLKSAGVEQAWPGHCTGTKAMEELRRQIGRRVSVLAVGGSAPISEDPAPQEAGRPN